jgi:hypothetical protein
MTKDFDLISVSLNTMRSDEMESNLVQFNIVFIQYYSPFVQVIQRRDDFGEPRENFNRDWADYKNGFGDPAKEFWMGNENIYMLTNNEDYALRIELEDFEGNKR